MRNEEMTDFDLKIRSLLEDAEEPVPSRLWKSVSGRLGAAAAPVVSPVWKWAGAALAAAAVIAGAVLLVPTSDRGDVILEKNAVAQAEILPNNNITEEAFSESESVFVASVPVVRAVAKQAAEASEAAVEPSVIAAETAGIPVAGETGTAVAEEKKAEKAASDNKDAAKKPSREKSAEEWVDPFAGLEEPAKKSALRPAALFAQGTLSGNDNGGTKVLQSRHGMKNAADATGIQEKSVSTYNIPVTFGLGVKFGLSERLSLGTGLEWSLLSRSFDGVYKGVQGNVVHDLQYIGIPINVYYDIIRSASANFYVWGGGDAQKCISNSYRIGASGDIFSKSVNGLQYSVGGGFGVEFALTDKLGVYIDPSARYWFGGNQPKSIRTEKPLTIGFEAGLRFNLQ